MGKADTDGRSLIRLELVQKRAKNKSDFARRIGITPAAIVNSINAQREVPLMHALAIEAEFGIRREWLMRGTGEMEKGTIYKKDSTMPAQKLQPERRTRFTPTYLDECNDFDALPDYWMVIAMNIEDGMEECGLQAGVDYTAADLWKLAQPLVMKKWEEGDLDLRWRRPPSEDDD